MRIPTDPKERFQYYFDTATGLDAKYQSRINEIKHETFDYDPKNSIEYKKAKMENAQQAEALKEQYRGSYAEFSQGYDNSMQKVAYEKVNKWEKEANKNMEKELYSAQYNAWRAGKEQRIENAKQRYAQAFANAVYNMQKANEEITLRKK